MKIFRTMAVSLAVAAVTFTTVPADARVNYAARMSALESAIGIDVTVVVANRLPADSPCAISGSRPRSFPYSGLFCGAIDSTIYIGNGAYRGSTGRLAWLLAHEFGHVDWYRTGHPTADAYTMERYADCYSGQRLRTLRAQRAISGSTYRNARQVVRRSGDSNHGTGAQRRAAFDGALCSGF